MAISVIRFGIKFATLANFRSLWQYLEDLFSIWRNFEPTLAKNYAFVQIFLPVKGRASDHFALGKVTVSWAH